MHDSGPSNHLGLSGAERGAATYFCSLFNTVAVPNRQYPGCMDAASNSVGNAKGVFPARSEHTGGVTHALADGSVMFMADSVDVTVYGASVRGMAARRVDPVTCV